MSEEDVKIEQPEEQAVEEPVVEQTQEESVPEEPKFSEAEQAAIEQGWRPPSEFNEEGKEPVSAEEFLRRGELFDKIKDLRHQYKRDTSRLEDKVHELSSLIKDERKRGYEQALTDLDVQRKEAVEIGDVDTFNRVDSEYNRIREEQAKLASQPEPQTPEQVPQAVIEFQDRNADWFNGNTPENTSMVNQAVAIEEHLTNTQPYLTEIQRLEQTEAEIKKLYPHRFSNPKKKQPPKVEAPKAESAPSAPSKSGLQIKFSDLDDRQKAACEAFVESNPNVTVEDYLKSVQEGLRIRNQL